MGCSRVAPTARREAICKCDKQTEISQIRCLCFANQMSQAACKNVPSSLSCSEMLFALNTLNVHLEDVVDKLVKQANIICL